MMTARHIEGNAVTVRPGVAPLDAPAPGCPAGKVLVRRVHAHVPLPPEAPTSGGGDTAWIGRLRRRYPRAWTKLLTYLWDEGLGQTLAKARTRAALERWSTAASAFAAVGLVLESTPPALPAGTPVLCWSWQGPVDADVHVVAPEQCLIVPGLAPGYALAPLLGWVVSVLRAVPGGIASARLVGLDPRLDAPLAALLGPPAADGRRAVVGWGAPPPARPGELAIHLSGTRAGGALIAAHAAGWVCRLPDGGHYILDPLYPGTPELPEPFGRAAVAEALDALAAHESVAPGVASSGRPRPPRTVFRARRSSPRPGALGVSCLGAGNYVRAVLLYQLRRWARLDVRGVMDVRPEIAAVQARALRAAFATTDAEAVVHDPGTDLVLIASDHASHADYAVAALRAGKLVHLDKPPVVTMAQLRGLVDCLRGVDRPRLRLGYGRPQAPAVVDLQARLAAVPGPTVVTSVVGGYRLGRAHWYHWPNQGTRIAGNLVHWIDLGYRLAGRSRPAWVEVVAPELAGADRDALTLCAGLDDGSRITVVFSCAGDETRGIREHIDVTREGFAARIDDFRVLRIEQAGRREIRRYRRDKGVGRLMRALAAAAAGAAPDAGLLQDLARTSAIQLAAQAALAEGGGRRSVAPFLLPEGW